MLTGNDTGLVRVEWACQNIDSDQMPGGWNPKRSGKVWPVWSLKDTVFHFIILFVSMSSGPRGGSSYQSRPHKVRETICPAILSYSMHFGLVV